MAKNERLPDALYCDDPSLTQQSEKDACDLNLIVENAKRGADISSSLTRRTPQYGDFTNLPSYKESLDIVAKANAAFAALDAHVRERFMNDPARMVAFLDNPANREEAIKLGLVQPPPVANPPPVAVESTAKKSVGGHGKSPKANEDE